MNIRRSIYRCFSLYQVFIRSDYHYSNDYHYIYHYEYYSKYCNDNHNIISNTKYRLYTLQHNKMSHVRPNCFVCIPLNNNKVVTEELVKIQNHVITKYEMLKECIVEQNKFHISLLILYIKKSQLEESRKAFHEAMKGIKKMNQMNICFDKLETFRNDVLYVSLKDESKNYIIDLIKILKESFEKRDIKIICNSKKSKRDDKKSKKNNKQGIKQNEDMHKINSSEEQITPHLTIMKNSYMKKIYMNKKPQIFPDYYSDFNLTKLMSEHLLPTKIQFLEMDIDSSTLYYKILEECNLS
ncbi:AKAP-like protein, putative [Plasmodium malariae]|uniref:AKAP-like protein, putative n=1 Tax=Plasmodium malariae TaxID=5858 RepID=A0A1C3KDS0_PLAMA|nr:AKAP-like protein, putative [Plasmodium malariae]